MLKCYIICCHCYSRYCRHAWSWLYLCRPGSGVVTCRHRQWEWPAGRHWRRQRRLSGTSGDCSAGVCLCHWADRGTSATHCRWSCTSLCSAVSCYSTSSRCCKNFIFLCLCQSSPKLLLVLRLVPCYCCGEWRIRQYNTTLDVIFSFTQKLT